VTAWNSIHKYKRFEGTFCFLLQQKFLFHLGQYYILNDISTPDEEN
jgi:hypothetical protein